MMRGLLNDNSLMGMKKKSEEIELGCQPIGSIEWNGHLDK